MSRLFFFPAASLLAGLMFIFFPTLSANAEEDMEQETGISATPRLWFSSIDPLAGAVVRKEAYVLPMYGLTLSIRPGSMPNYNLLITALFGKGEGDVILPGQTLSIDYTPPVGADIPLTLSSDVSQGTTEAERVDIEFLVRRLFPGKWYSIFFGPRFASWKETTTGTFGYTLSAGPIPTPFGEITIQDSQSGELFLDLDTKLYGFQVGLGTLAEMDEFGRHRLFSNFVVGAAYTEWEATGRVSTTGIPVETILEFIGLPDPALSGSHFNTSLDANLGYQHSGDRLGLSLRYRVFLLVEENAFEQTQFTTIHGPEVGVTYTF